MGLHAGQATPPRRWLHRPPPTRSTALTPVPNNPRVRHLGVQPLFVCPCLSRLPPGLVQTAFFLSSYLLCIPWHCTGLSFMPLTNWVSVRIWYEFARSHSLHMHFSLSTNKKIQLGSVPFFVLGPLPGQWKGPVCPINSSFFWTTSRHGHGHR